MWKWHCQNWEKKKICETLIVAMPLPKQGEKKICFGNCGNGIAENEKKKNVTKSVKE